MPKALSLLIVFLGLAVGSFAQTTTTFPKVVATFNRLNQTDAIPTTTIFTPKAGGLFRVTIYGAVTKARGRGYWRPNVTLTTEAGEVVYSVNMDTISVSPFVAEIFGGTWNKEGFPITVDVTANGDVTNTEYNVRVVIEQLM